MNEWFVGKIIYEAPDENGTYKKQTEECLVNAMSFTEAEAKMNKMMEGSFSNEFSVEAVKKEKVWEYKVSDNGEGIFFKSKVLLITLDEKSGKEKKQAVYVYTQNDDIKDAIRSVEKLMNTTMSDYYIGAIVETKIESIIFDD